MKASSLTTSPVNYAAFGMVEARGGLSTWFHSFFHVRKDKDPEQASSLEASCQDNQMILSQDFTV